MVGVVGLEPTTDGRIGYRPVLYQLSYTPIRWEGRNRTDKCGGKHPDAKPISITPIFQPLVVVKPFCDLLVPGFLIPRLLRHHSRQHARAELALDSYLHLCREEYEVGWSGIFVKTHCRWDSNPHAALISAGPLRGPMATISSLRVSRVMTPEYRSG